MEALLSTYNLNIESFNKLMLTVNGVIAGSSILSLVDNTFEPSDIDI